MERSINIAAIAVVAHHSLEEWHASLVDRAPDWLKTNGASGADIVFVINGFIMVYLIFACVLALSSLRWAVFGSTLSILALLMLALALPEGPARGFLANPITLEFCLGLALGWLVLA
ncbi:MAG: hypothetical protein HIU92_16365 [Proteobacteria bacterium]|nr:hypothetical protein [Pseudomonadota bacterium]